MQDSNLPAKFPVAWGSSAILGTIRAVPAASQIGISNGAASLATGFPPNCFQPIPGGGSWPWGQDFNGILNQITAWDQWMQAGGPVRYDAAFQTAIGGYPLGAEVMSGVTTGLFWISMADNNLTNPDAGGAGWVSWSALGSGVAYATVAALAAETARAEAAEAALSAVMFGVGQIWNNFLGLRALNTVYTNSTARPIFVYASVFVSLNDSQLGYYVNGTGAQQASAIGSYNFDNYTSVNFIVPAGATYEVVAVTGTIVNWNELR